MKDKLKSGLDKLKIKYCEEQIDKVIKFYEMIIEKNKVMNLTRITDPDDFIISHILDSLLLITKADLSGKEIIDIGTGGGFPGIPLKIFCYDSDITLLDSLNKRLVFLDEVINELNLSNIKTIHGRAEDLAHDDQYREKYDIAVSRAVSNLPTLSELCIPFVKPGGYFISYKSDDSDEEIKSADKICKILSGSINTERILLPDTKIYRKLVIINKNNNNYKKYTRKPSIIKKKPII